MKFLNDRFFQFLVMFLGILVISFVLFSVMPDILQNL